MEPKTIKIKNNTELGYRLINEDDFNEETDVKYETEKPSINEKIGNKKVTLP